MQNPIRELIPRNAVLRAGMKKGGISLFAQLRHLPFEAGHQFFPVGEPIPHAVFPLRGVVSLQLPVPPAKQVEIAMVGREGFAGAPLLLGTVRSPMLAVALTDGEAITIPTPVFHRLLRNSAFHSAAARYVSVFMTIVAQLSLCNRVHVLEKIVVGRLLQMHDRTDTATFRVTQNFFSRQLGIRRASVSRVAVRLQDLGAIEYDRRGLLKILDRHKLEKLACSCYSVIKGEFDSI